MSTAAGTGSARLCRGLVVVPGEEGLLIEGGSRRVWLPGSTAATVLPEMLGLLDGSHDAPAIRAQLGMTGRQFDHVLGVLDGYGLLEPAGGGSPGHGRAGDVAIYLSRSLGGRGDARGAAEALGTLGECAVLLTGDSPVLSLIAADLLEMGVRTVTQAADPARPAADLAKITGSASSAGTLIVAYDDPGDSLRHAVAAGRDAGVPVLRIAAGGDYADTGPLLRPGYTACLSCLRRGLAEAGLAAEAADYSRSGRTARVSQLPGGPGQERADPPDAVRWLLAGLAVTEVVALLAQIDATAPPRQMTRTRITGHDVIRRLVTPYPGCAECAGPAWPRSQDDATARDLALAYEWQLSRRIGEVVEPDRLLTSEKQRLLRLEAGRPSFPASPRMKLPTPASETPGAADTAPLTAAPFGSIRATPAAGLDTGLLAGLLTLIAGRRAGRGPAGKDWRWAPSGGNFGSPAAYLITRPGLVNLPGNCLRYDDAAHELIALRSGTVALRDAARGTDLPPDDLDAMLVLVADVGRLAGKYGSFAYRLAHLDAGCAAMQLAAVAAGCGLEVSLATSWDAQLAGLLELKPEAELVTVVTGLRASRGKESSCP